MRLILLATAIGSVAATASAQEAKPSALVEDVTKCRAITDANARLACFDSAVAALQEARDKREIVVVTRESVRDTRRRLFGISLPKIRLFGGDDDEEEREEIKEITAKIDRAWRSGYDRWTIKLEDGSTWQTLENFPSAEPKTGDSITIRRAALGSFMGSVNGLRSARIKRID